MVSRSLYSMFSELNDLYVYNVPFLAFLIVYLAEQVLIYSFIILMIRTLFSASLNSSDFVYILKNDTGCTSPHSVQPNLPC